MTPDIGTVFIIMMENRSFDHMLGHLHAINPAVNGIRRDDEDWLEKHSNNYKGTSWRAFRAAHPEASIPADPPHGRASIGMQLGGEQTNGFPLDGFVTSYAQADQRPVIDEDHPPAVMSWFDEGDVPVLSFLARQFAVCDSWFASVPAGTQPNRMMAMGGTTLLDRNNVPLPNQRLVYDWLDERQISWRVYHDGLPFFAMMPKWTRRTVLDKRFRGFEKLERDLAKADAAKFPRVVFIEPKYASAPHFGKSNDDHAPAGVANGQDFLRQVYEAISASPAIWPRSLTIITYDEHGGFYDHVSPPKISTRPPPGGAYEPFFSLGVRVPAVIVSPYINAGTVHHGVLDHTSILKLLGSLFGGKYGYEEPVNSRKVGNVLDILNTSAGRAAPKLPGKQNATLKNAAFDGSLPTGRVPGTVPQDELEWAFQAALDEIRKAPPDPEGRFDELLAAFPAETEGLT